ncbi:hypothetical protein EIN_177730 [Entamoeba invadens IP1]|uniref:hypothetical protein n=1 Tax=Entamoeba invadens IP1 TaxID=370355 RepID=UPI0002C3F64E|nr:hypothetical protein EIN_177730 [Entamoeba invadens IP1]ELP93876.1 hypothetical protein EIN_177730 [Entamoeba invadens IP1]|eukprot:XP_004260647.1 hypothetical protein EIN_177730 [Entamoeba invadens IP1]
MLCSSISPSIEQEERYLLTSTTTHTLFIDNSTSPHTSYYEELSQIERYVKLFNSNSVTKKDLQRLCWKGVPWHFRPKVWRILTNETPLSLSKQDTTLLQKRINYFQLRDQTLVELHEPELTSKTQIDKDLLRSNKFLNFLSHQRVISLMRNILLLFSIRHPASGYTQGMSDLLVPFVTVFLSEYIAVDTIVKSSIDILPKDFLNNVEADSYYAFDYILTNIQDYYTYQHQGVQQRIDQMNDILKTLDRDISKHFVREGLNISHFAFRWLTCCLSREFSIKVILRLWDSFLAFENGLGFSTLNMFCCLSLLERYKATLLTKSFTDLIYFLQNLPTQDWTDDDVMNLVTQAFILQYHFPLTDDL